MPSWGFHNQIHATYSDKSVALKLKSGKNDFAPLNVIPFSTFIKTLVPELSDGYKFNLHPFLFNGALQTLYASKADYSKEFQIYYGRCMVRYPEANHEYPHLHLGQATADFVVDPPTEIDEWNYFYNQTLPEGWPRLHPRTRFLTVQEEHDLEADWASNSGSIVVIIHGLAGGSHEPGIRDVSQHLHQAGFNVVTLNSRGCCRSKLSTGRLYSAVETDDLRYFIDELHKKIPNKLIYLLGFSLGSALVLNYLGEEGKKSFIKSAVTIGAPVDLLDSHYHLNYSYSGKYLFDPAVASFLSNLVKVNFPILNRDKPEVFSYEKKSKDYLVRRIVDFDRKYTAPAYGFASPKYYYQAGSPLTKLVNIHTPTVLLNSLDDPVVSCNLPVDEVKANPYLYLAASDLGGHLAYIQWDGGFWFSEAVSAYFKAFESELSNEPAQSDYEPQLSEYSYKTGI
ncbi:hypothetical protein LJB42_000036 [Komagataella kurtzmanii]|nr:hypothetical protein LJB42_000036 [Komagataella kurtzmanii]